MTVLRLHKGRCWCGGRIVEGICEECGYPLEVLLCASCGAYGEGVEESPCWECGDDNTVGCGPIGWAS